MPKGRTHPGAASHSLGEKKEILDLLGMCNYALPKDAVMLESLLPADSLLSGQDVINYIEKEAISVGDSERLRLRGREFIWDLPNSDGEDAKETSKARRTSSRPIPLDSLFDDDSASPASSSDEADNFTKNGSVIDPWDIPEHHTMKDMKASKAAEPDTELNEDSEVEPEESPALTVEVQHSTVKHHHTHSISVKMMVFTALLITGVAILITLVIMLMSKVIDTDIVDEL